MKIRNLMALGALLSTAFTALPAAAAVMCTLNGTLRYEPVDTYNCDTDFMACNEWRETDLDKRRGANASPLEYMRVEILDSNAAVVPLKVTHTNATGAYSATFPLDGNTCTGRVVFLRKKYMRVHESDIAAATPRYRFRIVDATPQENVRMITSEPVTLGGPTSTFNQLFPATNTTINGRAHAVYYTMNSAVREIATWSTNLSTRLASTVPTEQQPIVLDPSVTGNSATYSDPAGRGRMMLGYDSYRAGGIIRHELGHWVHQLAHKRLQAHTCFSYQRDGMEAHSYNTCEYSFAASMEGLAHFFAVRSVTSNDTNAWLCAYTNAPPDECARSIANRTADFDGDGAEEANSSWIILGDAFVNQTSRCTVPYPLGCGCGGTNEPACTSITGRSINGGRMEGQIARFLWDVIDSNNESGDDTDLAVQDVIAGLEAMPCSGTANGSCNEANSTPCNYDGYSIFDISDALPINGPRGEQILNCLGTYQRVPR